jgi:murein tripeptide amidase MpaA
VTPIISSSFDSGAIEFVSVRDSTAAADFALRIRKDAKAEFRQWFHFRLSGARGRVCVMRVENAGACTYPDGWKDYRAAASYDRSQWFRVPTRYDGSVLTIEHTPERDVVWYAYFEPYSLERHQALIARAAASPLAQVERLGASIDGRDLDVISVGNADGARKSVWIIARQHPGETMAEWFIEGMIDRLLDPSDAVSRQLLACAVLRIVPNMNPDGSVLGNLRTNAAGANLNREWMNPTLERSPEVFVVRERMQQTGVDFFLDVHGDEGLPYVFVAGSEMLPGFTAEQAKAQESFVADFKRACPDFQDVHGYSVSKYNEDALRLASKWVGHTFGCLSLTLEMPFKDNADLPDAQVGWNGARSMRLGAGVLEPLLRAVS